MSELEARHLALEVPETQRLLALVEEAALRDADLDLIERRLETGHELDAGLLAASALVVGRIGDLTRVPALERLAARLDAQRKFDHASAVRLAMGLCHPRPERVGVERADSGYRFVEPHRGTVLYVSDPLASIWHGRGRWGPPLRPDRDRAPRLAKAGDQLESLLAFAEEGGVLVICFSPPRYGAPEPPLRLCLAGFGRDAELSGLVRWSSIRSIGQVMGRRGDRAAIETRELPLLVMPESPQFPEKELLELMGRLLKSARS